MVSKGKKRGGSRDIKTPLQPPPLVTTLKRRNVVRWFVKTGFGGAAPNASTLSITYRNIADILNVADSTAIVAWQIFNTCVRVRRVSVWGAPSTTGAASTVTVDYGGLTGGQVGDSDRHTDTAIGTAQGPVVHARPKRMSQAAQWQPSTSAQTAFELACATGSIVELEYDGVNGEQLASNSVALAPVAANPGSSYARGLDGVAIAGSAFTTIGFSQN